MLVPLITVYAVSLRRRRNGRPRRGHQVRLDEPRADGRAPAAEAGHGVGGRGGAHGEGGGVGRGRVGDGTARGARVPRGDDGHDARRPLRVDGLLERAPAAALRGRATPGVGGEVGGPRRVRSRAVQPRGGEEELEALQVAGRGPVPLVHVAAADPPGPGGHAHLVSRAVVAQDRPHGVGAVAVVVAGLLGVVPAGPSAAVDRVVPVVVVVRRGAVPPPVLALEGRVGPSVARVLAAHDDALPLVAQRPHVGGLGPLDVPLHGRGEAGVPARFVGLEESSSSEDRELVVDHRVALDAFHVVAPRELNGELAVAAVTRRAFTMKKAWYLMPRASSQARRGFWERSAVSVRAS